MNLASRLEGLCKLYAVDLVIGEETAKMLDDPRCSNSTLSRSRARRRGRVYTMPPGRWTRGGTRPPRRAVPPIAGRIGPRRCALVGDAPLAAARYLAPLYRLYRHRIAHFQIEAPPGDWDGVYTAEEK